jgi:hypothetical protein
MCGNHSFFTHFKALVINAAFALQVAGEILPCCGAAYQKRRLVNNAACIARPSVIVTPT